uniref:Polyprenal reductase n=2 Tax=Wuchereria bancrofti TaxID=6293 RepID=A0A1I8EMF5_WUCBA
MRKMSFSLYQLCTTYWLACTMVICILGILALRKVRKSETIMGLVYFGKFRKDHNFKTWLRMIEVPKRLFWIFYLIASIAVLFALIDIVINRKLQYNDNLIPNLMGLLLYLTHVLRRLYECLYVSIFSDSNMNILHFLLGITFYPFCVCSQLASFTLLVEKTEINILTALFYTALAIAVFIVQIKQHHCFALLAQLRLNSGVNANNAYAIPSGGLFEHCLSPHYLLEIILYFLFALIYQLSTPMLLCFLFVTINQTIAALLNQNWYKRHFHKFFNNQKALIPYIL